MRISDWISDVCASDLAVVGKRDLAGTRLGATTHERVRAGRVMRTSIRPRAPARGVEAAAGDRGDRRAFQGFGFAGFGQQRWQARSEQRLAATGRAEQQQMVVSDRKSTRLNSRQ